jgi:hypothetical protein
MVAIYLIERSHNDLTPAFYPMGAVAISLAVTRCKKPPRRPHGEAQQPSQKRSA